MVKSKTSPNIILAAIDSRATGETYPVVATVPWKEGVENDNLYISQDTTKLNPTFLIGSNEQLDINPRSKSFTLEAVKIGVSTGEKTYADLNVTQEKATYEYTLEIKSKSGEITIPASGGSLELKGILTTWRNGRKVSTLETPFTMSGYAPGFSISGKTVTASNRGTVIGPSRAINIVGYTKNTIDGSTISGSVIITQEENKVTKVAPSVTLSYNPSEIPAKGGTSSPVVGNISYITTFSSGETLNDLPTSEYINTITKTNTFKIHTSNSPFSIDESTGVVTIGTRGTILGEALEETIYLTHRVRISYKDNIFEPTSNSITRTADITQQANTVTYSDINISLFGAADIPASGGQVSSGTVSYSQVASYTSGEFENITTGATITYGDPVSANSKDITISNSTVAGTLEVTVSLNGKTATKTVDVYQEQNKVTQIELLDSWAHNYSIEGTAAQNSVGPDLVSRTYNVKYTFLSGATSADKPGTEFGTLSDTVNYSWPGPSGSFTGLSAQSGNVTMASLGTTIVNETTSPQVTRTDKVTWTPSSNYSYKTLESNEIQKQAQVTREGNYVVDIQLPENVLSLSYNPSEIPAKGGSSSPTVTHSKEPSMIYTSGVRGEPGVIPANTYGSFYTDSNYELGTINSQYSTWKINAITGVLTVTSNKTARVDRGSAESKYHKNFRWVPSSVYNGGGADITRHATATVYQQANSIDNVAVTFGWHNNTNSVAASGGSLVVDVVVKNTYTSTSTNIIYPSATDAGISLTVSGVSGATVSKATITVPSRGSTVGPALTGTVTGNYNGTNSGNSLTFTQAENRVTKLEAGVRDPKTSTVHFWYTGQPIPASGGTATVVDNGKGVLTFSSGSVVTETTWSGQSKYGGTLSAGRTFSMVNGIVFTLNTTNGSVTAIDRGTTVGGIRSSNGVTSELTLTFTHPASMGSTKVKGSIRGTQVVGQQANQIEAYGNPTGGSLTVNDIPAKGGTISSGTIGGTVSQTRTYTSGSKDTYSQATPTNGTYSTGISGSNLDTTITSRTSKGTLTYSYTLNGKSGSISATVYQQANTWKDNRMTLSASSTSIGAGGGTVTLHTVVYRMYTSGTEGLGGNGLITNWSGSATGFTLSGFSLTAANRGTTVGNARSITITATYAHLTSNSVTVTQAANSLTWNNPVITFSYPGDIPASGGTITPTVSITQSGSYSSGSPASNTTIASKSFSGTGVNASTGAYTASSLGTTVKPRTNLVTATVTVTAQEKTASAKAGIWQAENAKTGYKNITINQFFYSDIPYSGGTVSPNSDVEYNTTHTSGATLNNHGLPPGHTATYIWTGSKPSWGTLSSTTGNVTATSNSGSSSRSTSVSMEILYNGSAIGVSASTTVTQKSQDKVSVTLSISLDIYGSGSINASRAVNDNLNVGWTQHDDMGNGSDNFVNLSVGQSSASIMSMNSSWSNYSIFQVNMQSSPPWVSGNWSYYW